MKKFRIPTIPTTESKSIRFPTTMIQDVEAEIQGKNINVPQLVAEIQNASYWIKIDDYTCKEIPIVEHENSAYVDIDF